MEERHHLTVDTYEEGKLTLDEYLGRVVFYQGAPVHPGAVSPLHVRAIGTLPRNDRAGRAAQGPARAEDRRGQQRRTRVECAPDSEVQAGRVGGFVHLLLLRPSPQARRRTSSGLRWTSPRRQPGRWSISRTRRCSSRSRTVWGSAAFSTRITAPPARSWLRSDCGLTTASAMDPASPRILTINGGSSSIKFALFEAGASLRRILEGGIERIGTAGGHLAGEGRGPGGQLFAVSDGAGSHGGGGRADGLDRGAQRARSP